MKFIPLVTATGVLHGMIGELANDCKESDMDKLNPKIKADCKKEREEDAKVIKGRYINHKDKTFPLNKAYCKWPGEPIQKWHLISGHVYDLPMGFVKEVNASGLIERSKEDTDRSNMQQVTGVFREHEIFPVNF